MSILLLYNEFKIQIMIWIPFYLLQFLIFLFFYIFQIVFSENNLVVYHYCINFNLVLSIKFSLIFLYNFCTDFPIYYCSCISFQLTLSSDDHDSFIFHKVFFILYENNDHNNNHNHVFLAVCLLISSLSLSFNLLS